MADTKPGATLAPTSAASSSKLARVPLGVTAALVAEHAVLMSMNGRVLASDDMVSVGGRFAVAMRFCVGSISGLGDGRAPARRRAGDARELVRRGDQHAVRILQVVSSGVRIRVPDRGSVV